MKEATLRLTIAWDAVEGVVFNTAYRFLRRYGGDHDETISDAQLLFLKAYEELDRSRASLEAYVTKRIWWGLLDQHKKKIKEMKRRRTLLDVHACRKSPREYEDWQTGLSSDAKTVCEAALHPPIDVEVYLAESKFRTESDRRRAVRLYLKDLGWSPTRISKAIKEVRSFLNLAS